MGTEEGRASSPRPSLHLLELMRTGGARKFPGLKGPRDPSSEEQLSTSVSAIDRQEAVFPWILS